jgi:hypothetical protein
VTPNDTVHAAGADDLILQWNDASGLGNHATQSAAGRCPIWKHNVINGKPVMRFDASNDGMATTAALNGALTILVVYSYAGDASRPGRTVQGGNNWLLGGYDLKYAIYNGNDFVAGPATTPGRFVVQTAWQSGLETRNYVDGELVGTLTGASAPGAVALGAAGGYAEPAEGDIAEVIAYDRALSDAERAGVEKYLAEKYGITVGT